jgi:hypothetical protein
MSTSPARVTVVTAPGCPFYAGVVNTLDKLAERHELTVIEVLAQTPEGVVLVDEFRPAMMPLVLVDGAYFSEGVLPAERLEQRLTAHRPA